MKYKLIYADPAWSYDRQVGNGIASDHYDTMSLNEIKNLPIESIADENCVLFMWGVVPLIDQCLSVIPAWGFKYKTMLFWEKTNCLGMGMWYRNNVEYIMVGIKGKVPCFKSSRKNIFHYSRGKHSQKPHLVYPMLEELNINPKIELFARHKREGWDCWGNQVPLLTQQILK